MSRSLARIGAAWSLAPLLSAAAVVGARWGDVGHRITGQAAAAALPAAMPAFFRAAAPQLAYLNAEPDRWRDSVERKIDPALDGGSAPAHYIDLDLIPRADRERVFAAPNRFAYADSLRPFGLSAQRTGLLPWEILEMTQRLRVDFRTWRLARDAGDRRWIEARAIDDAGLLGHYVADGSNPAHTTIHFNGWVGDNPHGYATDKRFHARFELDYVNAHIALSDVRPLVDSRPRLQLPLRRSILVYLERTNADVEPMYQLDQRDPFGADTRSARLEALHRRATRRWGGDAARSVVDGVGNERRQ